ENRSMVGAWSSDTEGSSSQRTVTRFTLISSEFARKCHIPIPFPGATVVGRESLRPNRTMRSADVPAKLHHDRFSFISVARIERADSVSKRANLRNIQNNRLAVCPVDAP